MQNNSDVSFEEIAGRGGSLGLITLTRTKVLNALNENMVKALMQQLSEWETADHIKAVVIQAAEGRAFCAGGDIRSIYEGKLANDPNLETFFHDEYRLNRYIHHYPKPYIALLNGITMGGGVGISIHASHRVATDKLMFAMPETGIGFFPDVGTTYYLARLPNYIGYYLGLTGVRIGLADCCAVGLVDYSVAQESLPEIIYSLADTEFDGQAKTVVADVIKKYVTTFLDDSSVLWAHREVIANCFSKNTVEEILHALEMQNSLWSREILAILKTKSPTSLKITLHAIQEAKHLDFDQSIAMEYRLTSRFVQGHDFFEGIRAVVIDKNQTPKWQPADLQGVTVQEVKKYFAPIENELAQ